MDTARVGAGWLRHQGNSLVDEVLVVAGCIRHGHGWTGCGSKAYVTARATANSIAGLVAGRYLRICGESSRQQDSPQSSSGATARARPKDRMTRGRRPIQQAVSFAFFAFSFIRAPV